MKVLHRYSPIVDKKGILLPYSCTDVISCKENPIREYSTRELEILQEAVMEFKGSAERSMKEYDLPERIKGEAETRFRFFDVLQYRNILPDKRIAKFGLPDFYIHTNWGDSSAVMKPRNGRITLSIRGALAEKTIKPSIPEDFYRLGVWCI